MKCNGCGGNLSIQDEQCPYCGAENPHYKKHRAQMRSFRKEYQDTREEVLEQSRHFTGFTVRITVIAVLVALDLLLILLIGNAWTVAGALEQRKVTANLKTHRAAMEELEREQDYIGLAKYYEAHSLYGNKALEEYEIVYRICSNYEYLYSNIMRLGIEGDYTEDEELVQSISDTLDYIYKCMERQDYYPAECYEGLHGETIGHIKDNLVALFVTYAHVGQAEAEKFPEISKGRRQVAMERGLGIGED